MSQTKITSLKDIDNYGTSTMKHIVLIFKSPVSINDPRYLSLKEYTFCQEVFESRSEFGTWLTWEEKSPLYNQHIKTENKYIEIHKIKAML